MRSGATSTPPAGFPRSRWGRLRSSSLLLIVASVILTVALARTLRMQADYALERFVPGDRVRIAPEHDWAGGAMGTVRLPPPHIVGEGSSWTRQVRRARSGRGELTFYWVEFDQPQRGADGGGPHRAGEIEEAYLAPPGQEQ